MPDPRRRARKRDEQNSHLARRFITAEVLAHPVHQDVPDVHRLIDRMHTDWFAYLTRRGGNRGPGGLRGWCSRYLSNLAEQVSADA